MKKYIILALMTLWTQPFLSGATAVESQIELHDLDGEDELFITYEKLRHRLQRTPELLAKFEELQFPEVRGDYETYLDRQYEFNQLLKKYELSARLIGAIKKFNTTMMPRKQVAWWKRKGIVIPLALALAAAGLFATWKGVEWKDQRLVSNLDAAIRDNRYDFNYLQLRHPELLEGVSSYDALNQSQKLKLAQAEKQLISAEEQLAIAQAHTTSASKVGMTRTLGDL
jgi:hypothetical protein